MTDQPRTGVVIEVTIGAPVEVVWQAMREPELIRRWHGWHCDDLDAEITLIYAEGAREVEPYVLEIEPGERFELLETAGGTTVRLTRPAKEALEGQWADWYDDITEGWTTFLHQLRFALERHPGAERRTVFLSAAGEPRQPLADVPADDVLFTAAHQRGLVLDRLGPGLVVIGQSDDPPKAMAVVTTYGLDDDAFAREQQDWEAWWRAAYPDAEPAAT